jgi:hypothetical protein
VNSAAAVGYELGLPEGRPSGWGTPSGRVLSSGPVPVTEVNESSDDLHALRLVVSGPLTDPFEVRDLGLGACDP